MDYAMCSNYTRAVMEIVSLDEKENSARCEPGDSFNGGTWPEDPLCGASGGSYECSSGDTDIECPADISTPGI